MIMSREARILFSGLHACLSTPGNTGPDLGAPVHLAMPAAANFVFEVAVGEIRAGATEDVKIDAKHILRGWTQLRHMHGELDAGPRQVELDVETAKLREAGETLKLLTSCEFPSAYFDVAAGADGAATSGDYCLSISVDDLNKGYGEDGASAQVVPIMMPDKVPWRQLAHFFGFSM